VCKDAERQPSQPIRVFQTPFLCGHHKTEGLKAPGYSNPRLPDVFRSQLTTHYSSLNTQRRLKDAKPARANSRGFSNPWNNDKKKKWRLQRRGTATLTADSRLPDAIFMRT
ncbi:MAG: hypothetical protein II261_10880, partial [Bacteroidaceae bacterium]|nr:hypothetical protein [Bacteroidaceae bacterium]